MVGASEICGVVELDQMSLRIFVFADSDCSFHVKVEGEGEARRFGDVLEALDFARSVTGARPAEVTVYDPMGKVVLSKVQIGNQDRIK